MMYLSAAMDDTGLVLKYFPDLTDLQLDQFDRLQSVFLEWNERINLISRKDTMHFYERHVLHSLGIAAVAPLPDCGRIMDLGTGGGFPGVPLAILYPECHFKLVDSIRKKITALQSMISELHIPNAEAIWKRAEDMDGTFDAVVTRAVAPAEKLIAWTRDRSNRLLALKGGHLEEEINAVRKTASARIHSLDRVFEEAFFETKAVLELQW